MTAPRLGPGLWTARAMGGSIRPQPLPPSYTTTRDTNSLPLTLLCKGAPIGSATGFFYRVEERYFLVSNWHVLSGRNPYTGQANHKLAALPDALGLALHRKDRLGEFVEGYSANLVDDQGTPKWLQDVRGQDVDVAVLPIDVFPSECVAYELPRPGEAKDMAFRVGMDAYVLGFPKGIAHQKYLPIWKRASIATEPDIPHDGLPVFLIDTATREGMSGAPVLLRSFGGYDTEAGDRTMGPGSFTRFVGVYSGRFGAEDEMGAQLGRVWHRSVIEEIVRNGVPGSYVLR